MLEPVGKYAQALTSHEWAIKISPKYSLALANQCATLNHLGNYEKALTACDSAIQGDGNWGDESPAIAWEQRGNALAGQGRYEEALTSYDRANQINFKDANVLVAKGMALVKIKKFQEALAMFEQALKIDPNNSLVQSVARKGRK